MNTFGIYEALELLINSSAKLTPTRPAPMIATLIFCISLAFSVSIPENKRNNIERHLPPKEFKLAYLYV